MIAAQAELRIERVPCMLVGLLAADGKLPALPPSIMALAKREKRRTPMLEEAAAYSWVIASDGDPETGKIFGVLGYRDVFDFHTATDVREIVYVAGPATVALMRWIRGDTARRLIGALDIGNGRMCRAMIAMGFKPKRIVFEGVP
jgi:hypothetical protein